MRNGLFRSLAALLASAGVSLADPPLLAEPDEPEQVAHWGAKATPADAFSPESGQPAQNQVGNRGWFTSESLLWWTKAHPMPVPILTTGSAADAIPGALGQPGTSILVGGQDIDTSTRLGMRFTAGLWLDQGGHVGVEGSYFFLGSSTETLSVLSNGAPGSATIAVPYYDTTTGAENATYISRPGMFGGPATLSITNRFQGAEANGICLLGSNASCRLEGLFGFRYLNLTEKLLFSTSSPNLPPRTVDVFETRDQFDASNNFYGGQLGARFEWCCKRLVVTTTGKVAMGAMNQDVNINGVLQTNDFNGFGAVQTFNGGYLAQPTNSGNYTRDRLAVVPEVSVLLGYQLTCRLRAFGGYNFLYVSDVARPGDQIDHQINPTQAEAINVVSPSNLVGTARPAFTFRETDFWAQGLTFGVELRY